MLLYWFRVHRQFYRIVLFYCYHNRGSKTIARTSGKLCVMTFCQQFSNLFLNFILYINWNSSPFSWIGHRGYLNFELTMWFFEIPCLSNKFLNLLKIFSFQPSDCSHMSTSNLVSCFGAGFFVVTTPTCPCRSKPIMHLVLRSVTRKVAPFTSQPADGRCVFNAPKTQISCSL